MIPPNINKENVLAAIKRIDSEGIHADRHLTVYVSSNDRALLMSRVFNRADDWERALWIREIRTSLKKPLESLIWLNRMMACFSGRCYTS